MADNKKLECEFLGIENEKQYQRWLEFKEQIAERINMKGEFDPCYKTLPIIAFKDDGTRMLRLHVNHDKSEAIYTQLGYYIDVMEPTDEEIVDDNEYEKLKSAALALTCLELKG